MRWPIAICLASMTVCSLWGCATAWNIQNEQRIYGGVRREASVLPYILKDSEPAKPENGFSTVLSMWAMADLPFSAVGDTLTLPITVPVTLMKQKEANAAKNTTTSREISSNVTATP